MESFKAGLYLCATPIGNLEDITLRVIRLFEEAILIAAEDTRKTRKLLTHYNLHKPLVSYHQHNWRQRSGELLAKADSGLWLWSAMQVCLAFQILALSWCSWLQKPDPSDSAAGQCGIHCFGALRPCHRQIQL